MPRVATANCPDGFDKPSASRGPTAELGILTQASVTKDVKGLPPGVATGAVIVALDECGAARRAGLKTGDAVIFWNGEQVVGAEDFHRISVATKPDGAITLKVIRDGLPVDVSWKADSKRSISELDAACQAGSSSACVWLTIAHRTGLGVVADPTRALAPAKRACELDKSACAPLAGLELGLTPPDNAAAFLHASSACDKGETDACYLQGVLLVKGLGTPVDLDAGFNLLGSYCDVGVEEACNVFLNPALRTSPLDLKEARVIRERSCARGSSQGCSFLAAMVNGGIGGKKDPARAVKLYESACGLGGHFACLMAAQAYEWGNAVGKDVPQAMALYRQSCHEDHPLGCASLSFATHNGQGLPQDRIQVVTTLRAACDKGNKDACDQLGQVASQQK